MRWMGPGMAVIDLSTSYRDAGTRWIWGRGKRNGALSGSKRAAGLLSISRSGDAYPCSHPSVCQCHQVNFFSSKPPLASTDTRTRVPKRWEKQSQIVAGAVCRVGRCGHKHWGLRGRRCHTHQTKSLWNILRLDRKHASDVAWHRAAHKWSLWAHCERFDSYGLWCFCGRSHRSRASIRSTL